jgi:hypothetical protein
MDEWKPNDRTGIAIFRGKHKHSGRDTLRKIEREVKLYLAEPDVQQELEDCARILVRRRRLQTRDQSKWDRFASASCYICPYDKCKERRHDTLENYKRHVLRDHHQEATPKQLEKEARLAKQCWLYRGNGGQSTGDTRATNEEQNSPDTLEPNAAATSGST